jgi:uncharacterized protein (DUF1778 family)
MTKSTVIYIRVTPEVKALIVAAAKREKRSVTNFIESDPRVKVEKKK